jgi:autotransporter-associated beta strand protein
MKKFSKLVGFIALVAMLATPVVAQRQIEILTRGTTAIRTGASSVLVSWRWLATDHDDVAFNVYRDGLLINASPLTTKTNILDNTAVNGTYVVKAIIGGVEQESSESVAVMANTYFDVALQIPPGGTTPSGEAYTYSANDASVGDVDGDGVYEIILKWDPSNAKDNSQSGYTGNVYIDAYKLNGTLLWRIDLGKNIRAGAHYTQFMVYDLDGDGKAEVACKTAPGTKGGNGSFLALGPAATDTDASDYRNTNGYILTGPEYLTIFNGATGVEMATVNYNPPRGTVSSWGDSYGNRVDRFLACVAYLDGERPSLVMCRGYYSRSTLAAWDWRNGTLSQRWFFDSNTSGNGGYFGQGNHNLSVADVDGDGKDEIIYGSCTIDDNGTGLYTTGLGHGDALHVTDHAPSRPGFEVFAPHEESGRGISFRDGKTGAIIWQKKALGDIGRGAAADIRADHHGSEFWASGMGMYNVKGEQIATGTPAINHLVWWDGDLLRELLDGVTISKYGSGSLLSASGCSSINGTKANPNLQVDLWGDWREEVIWRTTDNTKLRIFSTPYTSDFRFRTLMHDPTYRLGVAWQNVAYNQPPHVGFYLGNGMESPALQPVVQAELKWAGSNGFNWDDVSLNWKNNTSQTVPFANGASVLFTLSGNNSSPILLTGNVSPKSVAVMSPTNYEFGGAGSFSGDMQLIKAQSGRLTLTGNNAYTGNTSVSEGLLVNNGSLSQSPVFVTAKGGLSGTGSFGQNVSLKGGAMLYVGNYTTAGTTQFDSNVNLDGNAFVVFELSSDINSNNDLMAIGGNLEINGANTVVITKSDGQLANGDYLLATITGSIVGDLSNLKFEGLTGVTHSLSFTDGKLLLTVLNPRGAASVVWSGSVNSKMDLLSTTNWLNNSVADVLAPADNILFDNSGISSVDVTGELPLGTIVVNASQSYTFTGTGAISGSASLQKDGTGVLKLNGENTYTGPTVVNGGVLDVSFITSAGQPSPIGAASANAANLVVNGGKIRYSGGKADTNRGLTIGANGGELEISQGSTTLLLDGAITGGNLVKSGSGTLVLMGPNKNNDKLTITAGNVRLYSDDAAPAKTVSLEGGTLFCHENTSFNTMGWNIEVPSPKVGTINMDVRGYVTGSLSGGGTLNLRIPSNTLDLNGNWSAFTGTINVLNTSSGTGGCRFGNSLGWPNASVDIGSGINAYHISNTATKLGAVTGAGSLTGNHVWEIGSKNTNFSFGGQITAGSLYKVGTGRMTLTNANAYSGGTIIYDGYLIVSNTTGSATGVGGVSVRNGGNLAGTGTIGGSLTVQSGGIVLPGALSTIGTLNVGNNVSMQEGGVLNVDVDASNNTCDILNVVAHSVTLQNASLVVMRRSGSYQTGNSFKIINSPSINGTFASISPAQPADGLYWDLSELNTLGIVKITDVPTAVKPSALMSQVSVFPNPVADILTVSLPSVGGKVTVEVTDVNGRLVYSTISEGALNLEIPFAALNRGIYLLRVSDGKGVVVRKITKK